MKVLTLLATLTITLTGCMQVSQIEIPVEDILAAKAIVDNRKVHAKDIVTGINECVKSANTLTHLTAAGNDAQEVVEECTKSVQITYGAYTTWRESYLIGISHLTPEKGHYKKAGF